MIIKEKEYKISKNVISFTKAPKKKGVIRITFQPTQEWMETDGVTVFPIATTEITGKKRYSLPKGVLSVTRVEILNKPK